MKEAINEDIEKAVTILKKFGAKKVYLFGSLAEDRNTEDSDIDLAVSGLPETVFLKVGGHIMLELKRNIDLIDIDEVNPFTSYLKEKGKLVHVGIKQKRRRGYRYVSSKRTSP